MRADPDSIDYLLEAVMRRFSRFVPVLAAGVLLLGPSPARAQSFTVEKHDIGGEGGTDYLTADPATGRVFISRGTHVMVVDGATGKVVGDIMDTPRVHGIAFAPKWKRGFSTNAGDSTVTMFDLGTLAVIRKIHAGKDGLDGIMYDDASDRILTINHSRPMGSAVVIDPAKGEVVGTIALGGMAPEGGASDGKGRIFINIEDRNSIDVVDTKSWKVVGSYPIPGCDGPTGIAMDRSSGRLFAGCSRSSVVVDAASGRVVATLANGNGVDAMGWDQGEKLMYIPAGRDGNVTVIREDGPDRYTTIATVPTMAGAKTVAVDEARHMAYLFTPQYGPAPAPAPGAPAPTGRGPRGPVTAAWLIRITH